ncbi:MAG: hypothetical protein AB7N24_07305 [Dehalococcoidia bacterium]
MILVSKFEPGFAARLHEAVDRLPELFDEAAIASRYGGAPPEGNRTEAWRTAVGGLLSEIGPLRGLDQDQLAEIQAGVDSVAGLLDSVLWSGPTVGDQWSPGDSERAAFEEAKARMDDESSIFTRYYGEFDGRRVENHCPGALIARRLFEEAWNICTG